MLVLLDLDGAAVLEGPLDDVFLDPRALDVLRRLDGRPELLEVAQLDEVPHVREGSPDDGALNHLVGSGDGHGLSPGGRHFWS